MRSRVQNRGEQGADVERERSFFAGRIHTTVSAITSGRSSTGVDVRRCGELRLDLDVRRRRENITDVFDQELRIQCDDALDDGALMKCATSGGHEQLPVRELALTLSGNPGRQYILRTRSADDGPVSPNAEIAKRCSRRTRRRGSVPATAADTNGMAPRFIRH